MEASGLWLIKSAAVNILKTQATLMDVIEGHVHKEKIMIKTKNKSITANFKSNFLSVVKRKVSADKNIRAQQILKTTNRNNGLILFP